MSGISFTNGGFSITAVPEPASLGLVGIAFGAFAIRCWRQKRKKGRVGNRQ
ncbi:MAG: PEP-CTERM sorting domain-containing protein [Pirellula staleyi]